MFLYVTIFIIYTGGEAKLNNFLANLNMMNNRINLDYEKSLHSKAFLDTLIYTDKKRQLQTALHTKPTNTTQLFRFQIFPPQISQRYSLPNSVAIRLRRIYIDDNEIKKSKLKQRFLVRGYPYTLIGNQTTKAISTPRQDTLKQRPNDL